MKKNGIIALAVTIVIIGLMAVKLVINKREIDSKKLPVASEKAAITVTAEKAQLLPATISISKTGTLLPFAEVDITSAAQGKLESVLFELGTKVKKGQVLAKVDSKLLEISLHQTELTISKLEKDYERFLVLQKGNAATEMNVNEIKFNLDNAKNQAEQIRKRIQDATVTAPINGTVIRKNFEQGVFINPGMPLGTIVDISKLKVQLSVTEAEAYQLTENQQAKVTTDIGGIHVLYGRINYISPVGDHAHNYLVEITLDNKQNNSMKAGTFVYVDFSGDTIQQALQIPRDALVESLRNPYVYVAEHDVAKKRIIKTGREFGKMIEVIEGLQPGDLVITSGQINLNDGAAIKIVSN